MSKISRGQKGEEQVIKVLDGVKEYHHLLNNVTLMNYESGMSHQLDHILIHPHGIFVIETKNYFGDITYNPANKKWTATIKGNSKISGIHYCKINHMRLLCIKLFKVDIRLFPLSYSRRIMPLIWTMKTSSISMICYYSSIHIHMNTS